MKCLACNGKGFLEYESGLIRVPCPTCKGTGEVKIRESMKGNKNRKNGKRNRNDR